jgi:hypothetical protein
LRRWRLSCDVWESICNENVPCDLSCDKVTSFLSALAAGTHPLPDPGLFPNIVDDMLDRKKRARLALGLSRNGIARGGCADLSRDHSDDLGEVTFRGDNEDLR